MLNKNWSLFLLCLSSTTYASYNPVGTGSNHSFQMMLGANINKGFEYENEKTNNPIHSKRQFLDLEIDTSISYHLTTNTDFRVGYNFQTVSNSVGDYQGCSIVSGLYCNSIPSYWSDSGLKFSLVFFNKTTHDGFEIGTRLISERKIIEHASEVDLSITGQSAIFAFEKNASRYFHDQLGLVTSVGYEHFFMNIEGRSFSENEYEADVNYAKIFLKFALVSSF